MTQIFSLLLSCSFCSDLVRRSASLPLFSWFNFVRDTGHTFLWFQCGSIFFALVSRWRLCVFKLIGTGKIKMAMLSKWFQVYVETWCAFCAVVLSLLLVHFNHFNLLSIHLYVTWLCSKRKMFSSFRLFCVARRFHSFFYFIFHRSFALILHLQRTSFATPFLYALWWLWIFSCLFTLFSFRFFMCTNIIFFMKKRQRSTTFLCIDWISVWKCRTGNFSLCYIFIISFILVILLVFCQVERQKSTINELDGVSS